MNIQKFTQKSLQAVQGCENLAVEYGNQEIEQEHLLLSLLTVEEAASYFGIGRDKIKEISNDDRCSFVLWVGTKRMIKRK